MIHWTDAERAALEAEREEIRTRLRYLDVLLADHGHRDDDDATLKFPPIRDTVHLRRPPPPVVRELGRDELLRAIALEVLADGPAPSVTGDESGSDL
jgi:hypothetical protein